MNCPHDGTVLWVARRSGIEVDVCPQCRGVWSDRGELDKIIARADDPAAPRLPPFRTKPIQTIPPDAAETRPGNWLGDLFEDTPPPERAP